MSIKYLVDTNIISEPTRPSPDSHVVTQLRMNYSEIAIPSVVLHELLFGIERLPHGKKRVELKDYFENIVLNTIAVLPYDADAALWHATERAKLQSIGISLPFVDGQIASIAVINQLVLVTRNLDDFKHYSDLEIENWYST